MSDTILSRVGPSSQFPRHQEVCAEVWCSPARKSGLSPESRDFVFSRSISRATITLAQEECHPEEWLEVDRSRGDVNAEGHSVKVTWFTRRVAERRRRRSGTPLRTW